MVWKKYHSINNLIRKDLNFEGEWVTIEKIHGCNFSIIWNGESLSYARRRDVLKPDEKFYNYQTKDQNKKYQE